MTILIILGIVIIASVVTVYTFRERIFASQFDRERAEALSVPEEAEELHDYLSDCVQEVVTDPVLIMGLQGGYVDIPEDPIGEGAHNPFSNALEIFPDTDFETAYWFYVAANGLPQSQVPTIEDMELELETYVNEHLTECANDAEMYESFNASVGDVFTEVTIEDDEIQYVVEYPVEIVIDDFIFTFEKFYQTVDVPLGSMYESAVEIMDTENEEFFLEELTYDTFVLYDELPGSWTDFECDQETWVLEDVEEDFQEIIMHNMLAIKIEGTEYSINTESDEKYFEWDALKSGTDYRANVMHSTNWPMSLDVYPAEDGVLEADTLTGAGLGSVLRSLFCMSQYNFIYDIEYPVLISLYDEDSDYTFQFATMVVLDNNQPRENELGTLDLTDVESPICDDLVAPITVYASEVDASGNLVDIADVDITFQCINNVCPLGETQGRYGDASLETFVPGCVNGQIIGSKEGYADDLVIVTTLEETTVELILEKFVNLTYDIKIVDQDGNTRSPRSDEVLFVTLTEEDSGYITTASHPEGSETILLIPGTYQVDGTMVSDVLFDINIDASSYEKCSSISLVSLFGLFNSETCADIDVDALELENAISGGVDLSWEPERSDLNVASHVTFYVTSPGEPEDLDEVEEVLAYLDTGLGFREPELS